jgi:addiction module RelB/DinJ family antitoxin
MKRSANIQARVRPEIKSAGEDVLRRIGMTMTGALELFLRPLIVDQKLPFQVVALDEQVFAAIDDTPRRATESDNARSEAKKCALQAFQIAALGTFNLITAAAAPT